jgi:hypothetical protein
VKSNAPPHGDTDGSDLFIINPNSCKRRPSGADEAKISQSMDRRLFQVSDVAVHVFS